MVKLGQNSLIVADLTENIWIYTRISPENHAALRSGFAGYRANPRWSATKYLAWKQGYQWREDLSIGRLTIRQSDSQLLATTEIQKTTSVKSVILHQRILVS